MVVPTACNGWSESERNWNAVPAGMATDRPGAASITMSCWLVRSHGRFAASRGNLIIYAVPPLVTDLLDFVGLRSHLRIAASEPQALLYEPNLAV